LSVDHQPIENQNIQVIDAEADSVLYSGNTDSTGNFHWEFSEKFGGKKVYVLAKIRTEKILTSELEEIILSSKGNKCSFNIISDSLHPINVQLKGQQGVPEGFSLHIHPIEVSGIPKNIMPYLSSDGNNILSFYHYQYYDSPLIKLNIKKGNYSVEVNDLPDGSSTIPKPINFITSKVMSDGKPLKMDDSGEIEIKIESPKKITFYMTPEKD
jgi:hypothetical protein